MTATLKARAMYGMPFTDENIPLLLSGQKTQTRRDAKKHNLRVNLRHDIHTHGHTITAGGPYRAQYIDGQVLIQPTETIQLALQPEQYTVITRKYGTVGDLIYSREVHRFLDYRLAPSGQHEFLVEYRADQTQVWKSPGEDQRGMDAVWTWLLAQGETPHWRPPMFQFKWAARMHFETTGLTVERLNLISHEDAMAEGLIEVADMPEAPWGKAYGISPDKLTNRTAEAAYARIWEGIHGKGSFGDQLVYAFTLKKVKDPHVGL